ncbi:MAG: hypothetical protein COY42_23510 [Armatimonadetes bacterium CG_4_10_14_0_8_um_filter_66_14]|nr:MAG: hypothetical protein AUJ96_20330 [Armatimonadetes bacterium CG2_30_66_41]PIZ37991.1 MAG: hypothetical protein COY42_23510 [Armatimonadetes bacterium CG_4_10_14_0_8_um_filter_66_14]
MLIVGAQEAVDFGAGAVHQTLEAQQHQAPVGRLLAHSAHEQLAGGRRRTGEDIRERARLGVVRQVFRLTAGDGMGDTAGR